MRHFTFYEVNVCGNKKDEIYIILKIDDVYFLKKNLGPFHELIFFAAQSIIQANINRTQCPKLQFT